MANGMGLVNEGLWRRDRDFQKLPRLAQCTFVQVLSQKDLDTAGVLTLYLGILVKACAELTEEQLRADFAALESARFLFVDYDTDEVLIRSYARLVSTKATNAWRSVPKNARLIASEKIRRELAIELRRIDRKDARDLATEIDPIPIPSRSHPDPIPTGSQPDTPSRPHPDPPSQVPVKYEYSPLVGGSVGEDPRPNCPDHEENFDGPCHACRRRREWDEQHESQIAADELERKRQRREAASNCPMCHGTNVIEIGENKVRKCDHASESRHA